VAEHDPVRECTSLHTNDRPPILGGGLDHPFVGDETQIMVVPRQASGLPSGVLGVHGDLLLEHRFHHPRFMDGQRALHLRVLDPCRLDDVRVTR
jgi:hypothetical protein